MLIDEIRQGESAELELKRVPDEQGRTRLVYLEGYRDGTGRRRVELLVDAIGRFFATQKNRGHVALAVGDVL